MNPEVPQQNNATLFERLKELLRNLLVRKKLDEDRAQEAEKEKQAVETRQKWREEEERRREKDRVRAYHERKSEEETVERIEQAITLHAAEVQEHFDNFISERGREGSGYLFEIARDGDIQNNIKEVIAQNPKVAYLIDELITKGREIHGDADTLIALSKNLLYEAGRTAGGIEKIRPLINGMNRRAADIIVETVEEREKEINKEIPLDKYLSQYVEVGITPDEDNILRDRNRGEDVFIRKIDAISGILGRDIEAKIAHVQAHPKSAAQMQWVNEGDKEIDAAAPQPPAKVVEAVDRIWDKVCRSEESGILTVKELQDLDKELLEAESSGFPKDVIPGTKAWFKAVEGAHSYIKDRRNELVHQLQERLKNEKPSVKKVKTTREFLLEWAKHPGYLGSFLRDNPEIEKIMISPSEEGRRFRNQVFLSIHKKVLTDNYHSSRENFGLYEGADMDTFLKLISAEMAEMIRPETGVSHGQTWEEWYVNLSNTVQLSRDIDYWAAQPGATIEDMGKSLAMFQNANSVQALTMPAVQHAYRAYEDVLQSIKDSNDGYTPPVLFQYDAANLLSYWDTRSKQMLANWMQLGVVKDVDRDEFGFHTVESDGNTVKSGKVLKYDDLHTTDPQDLELSMYMMLGKGFGLASLRYLEMFANAKIPGSQQKGFSAQGFHSLPYEGPARSLNWFADMIHKWRFGSIKFMHLMNTLLPNEQKIYHINDSTPMEVYKSFMDGSAKTKYGKDVKRLYDLVNFSGCSSAFGPPYTQWRHMDASFGWSDKKRELLGDPTIIMYSKRFSGERIKGFLVVNRFREEFREQMAKQGMPTSGEQFDRLWNSKLEKDADYKKEIDEEWEKMEKSHKKEIADLADKYRKALIARTWVHMAMRNPLNVAHNMTVEVPDELQPGKNKEIKLHSFIAQQVLGIPLEDVKYGEVACKVAWDSSPTQKQRAYMDEILSLETDIAAVREQAVEVEGEQKGYYRELRLDDFDILKGARRDHAIKYWQMVRKAMMGDLSDHRHEELYRKFGLSYAQNQEDYAININQIKKIDETLREIGNKEITLDDEGKIKMKVRLSNEWVDKDWDLTFGSDDTDYRKMNVSNLGPRQWARRGGDAVAHYQGGTKAGEYMRDLPPSPNVEDLAKMLRDIRLAYEGDMIEAGWQVAGLLSHATSRLYAFDYSRLGSAAQLDVWGTRRGVAAWNANNRRKFFDALEHMDVLPPLPAEESLEKSLYNVQSGCYNIPHDIHSLRKANRAGNVDVWTEIITLGIILAFLITLYRAFTAPSEEEEKK